MAYYGWKPYVPVGERRRQASGKMERMRKEGHVIQPVEIEGRKITTSYWGGAWCDHFESLGDYANRLPRGRTYVRNGSVCHLAIGKGQIDAFVSGSELYRIRIAIKVLPQMKWTRIRQRCGGQIGSLIELLQGKLSKEVMTVVADRTDGLFPLANEIDLKCNCPDWAGMCKHLAAVLYGVGARLDLQPELLFLLRGVNHEELVDLEAEQAASLTARTRTGRRTVAERDLSDVFGIDLNEKAPAAVGPLPAPKGKRIIGKKKKPIRKAVGVAKATPVKKKRRGEGKSVGTGSGVARKKKPRTAARGPS